LSRPDGAENESGRKRVSDRTFLVLLVVASVFAVALGIWIGLGYPGLYDRFEDTGSRAERKAPVRTLLDRLRRSSGSPRHGRDKRPGTGRWSRR
jgi:hypothetical protein